MNNNQRLGAHYNRYQQNWTPNENNIGNDYNVAYSADNNKSLSIQREPDVQYEETIHYLVVSSSDRNVVDYPNVNNYVINLQDEIKNITSIQLIQAIIPDKNDVTQEPFLLLKISEMEDVMISNNRNISDAFAILQMASPVSSGFFIEIDTKIHENCVKYYKTPKSSLSRLTVSITDSQGNLFDFGSDSPSPPKKDLQNLFVFKLTTLESKRDRLNQRGIF